VVGPDDCDQNFWHDLSRCKLIVVALVVGYFAKKDVVVIKPQISIRGSNYSSKYKIKLSIQDCSSIGSWADFCFLRKTGRYNVSQS
jgi:hypothetical protein